MDHKPSGKKGMERIWSAFRYSLSGLRFAVTRETAFIQELCIYVILLVVLFFLPLSITFKCILFFANSIVLVAELLNSAVEAIVDIASPDYHDLAKQAKDIGSAAVLVSIMTAAALWVFAIVLMVNDS